MWFSFGSLSSCVSTVFCSAGVWSIVFACVNSVLFVASLYVWSQASMHDRDNIQVIQKRMTSTTAVAIILPILFHTLHQLQWTTPQTLVVTTNQSYAWPLTHDEIKVSYYACTAHHTCDE